MSPVKYEGEQLSDEIYFDYENESDIAVFRSLGENYPNTTSLRIMPGLHNFEEAFHNNLSVINSIPINDDSFESLERLYCLQNLELNNIPFHGDGLQYLASTKLNRLYVMRCPIHDVFFESMTSVPYLETLVVEDHFHTLTSPDLGYLQSNLKLDFCDFAGMNLTDVSFDHFPSLPLLRVLGMEGNNITCENFQFIKDLPKLEDLILTNTKITLTGIEVISSHAPPKLERLSLMHCHANNDWAKHISKLSQLKVLFFNKGCFTDKCIADFQNMQNLEYLSFDSCDISEKACKAIHNVCDKATVVLPNGNELESKKQKRIRRRYE